MSPAYWTSRGVAPPSQAHARDTTIHGSVQVTPYTRSGDIAGHGSSSDAVTGTVRGQKQGLEPKRSVTDGAAFSTGIHTTGQRHVPVESDTESEACQGEDELLVILVWNAASVTGAAPSVQPTGSGTEQDMPAFDILQQMCEPCGPRAVRPASDSAHPRTAAAGEAVRTDSEAASSRRSREDVKFAAVTTSRNFDAAGTRESVRLSLHMLVTSNFVSYRRTRGRQRSP